MQLRTTILLATSVAVVLALVLLVVQTGDTPSSDLPEDEIEAARQRHERAQSRAERRREAVQPTITSRPVTRRRDNPTPASAANTQADNFGITAARPSAPSVPEPEPEADPEDLNTRMAEANQLYDRRDYEGALSVAREILKDSPGNIRMLRVVVSSTCIMGEEDAARESFALLPERHQRQMRRRCQRYGIELGEP